MIKLSIIFGFRNRETDLVKNCMMSLSNQSFKDFEVLFVDYGSDPEFSEPLKKMLSAYSFVTYIYNTTTGMPWNRAHALNTGIRLARGEYIFTSDTDLIFSPDYFQEFCGRVNKNKIIYSNVYLLNKGQEYSAGIKKSDLKIQSGGSGIGIYPSEKLKEIGGYDEYYKIWGCEDRDLKQRFSMTAVEQETMEIENAPVYHQWHPLTNFERNFLPIGWWEDMNYYYFRKKNEINRGGNLWGKLYSNLDRRALNVLDKKNYFKANSYNNIVTLFEEITEKFSTLAAGDFIKVECEILEIKADLKSFIPVNKFYRVFNRLLYFFSKDQKIINFSRLNIEYEKKDIIQLYQVTSELVKDFAWIFLRNFEMEIYDYYYGMKDKKFIFIVIKK
jgi:glycosyltransferase involved in cell wall biosynthesis